MERAHANVADGTFGGASYGAAERCTEWAGRMRTPPRGHSVELPVWPRSAVLGVADACERRHWRLRCNGILGHEA
eukprot:2656298-Pyramimonas_sp.AAC.1